LLINYIAQRKTAKLVATEAALHSTVGQ